MMDQIASVVVFVFLVSMALAGIAMIWVGAFLILRELWRERL